MPTSRGRIWQEPRRSSEAAKDAAGGPRPYAIPPAGQTPFTGRESQLLELGEILSDAARGRGALVLFGGEPGVGKSRLMHEVALRGCAGGLMTLSGRCHEISCTGPYVPFAEAIEAAARELSAGLLREVLGPSAAAVVRVVPELGRLFPDIPSMFEVPAEQERRHLFNGLCDFLERMSRARGLFLCLDDLHWADEATLLLLEHLAERLPELRMLVVGTYRDMRADMGPALLSTMERLLRHRLVRILRLQRLPRPDVQAMLHAMSGQDPPPVVVDAVYRETDGNPFFVEEVIRSLDEEGGLFDVEGRWRLDLRVGELDVPENVRLVVERRLDRLSSDARSLLRVAAVIGRDLELQLLEALDTFTPEVLLSSIDEATRASLLLPAGDARHPRLAFAHELVRQSLLAELSIPRRQRIHRSVAEALERLYAGRLEERAVEMAQHLYHSGPDRDPAKLLHHLGVAGTHALDAAAFDTALGIYETALSLNSPDHLSGRAELLSRHAWALAGLGRWDDAVRVLREALAIHEQLGERGSLALVTTWLAGGLAASGRLTEAVDAARRALPLIAEAANGFRVSGSGYPSGGFPPPDVPTSSVYHPFLSIAATLRLAGRWQEAEDAIRRTSALAERQGDRDLLAASLHAQAQYQVLSMRFAEVVESARRVAEVSRTSRPERASWILIDALLWNQLALWYMGRGREANAVKAELDPLVEGAGPGSGRPILIKLFEGFRSLAEDPNLEALAQVGIDELDRSRKDSPFMMPLCYGCLAHVQFLLGHWDESLTSAQEAYRLTPPGLVLWCGWNVVFLVRAYAGRRDEALAMLSDVRGEFPQEGSISSWAAWTMVLTAVEGLAVLGEREEAGRLYPLVLSCLDAGVVRRADHRLVQLVAGIAASAAERWDEADAHFGVALRQAEELPDRIQQPDVRRFWAQMLVDRDGPGDREQARALLHEAVAEFERIGMPRHKEMAAELLRSLGEAGASNRLRRSADARPGSNDVLFRREGEYWAIGPADRPFRLRATAGLAHLARLIAQPGQEIHVLELVAALRGSQRPGAASSVPAAGRASAAADSLHVDAGGAGALLDPQAKAAYRRRLLDLRDELQQAEDWGDAERAAKARYEIDALTEELARSVGLGGRDRVAGSASERARVNVTKAIKGALARIGEHDASLGQLLRSSIRTGTFCSFNPGPSVPVVLKV